MKHALLSLTAMTLLAPPSLAPSWAEAQDGAPVPVNLIEQGRNMAALNDQNLTDQSFLVPTAPDGSTQFVFNLKGYVFGLRMIRANYMGYVGDNDYAAYTDLRTSGLGALLKKLEIWAVSRGRVGPDGAIRPDFHVQQNMDKKNRRVEMRYDNDARLVDTTIVPPLGSQGIPPASDKERFTSFDTVSALLHMTRKGQDDSDSLCKGRVPVFDSKQHYYLRLEPVGTDRVKFLGDKQTAIHCHVYYEPISGFDPEDLPEPDEAETPVDVYFQYYPDADIHVPVRFAYKISGFTAIIKMTDLVIVSPDGAVISTAD